MRKLLIFLWLALLPLCAITQTLELQECTRLAKEHNPLANNRQLANQLDSIRTNVIKKAWLPAIELNAQASWQSDVVALDLDLPFPVNLPKIPHNQYRATLEVSQLIYDGGTTKSSQILNEISTRISSQEVDVEEQSLVETVEDLYFSIMLINKRIDVLRLMKESLSATQKQVESGVLNGVLSEPDILGVRAESIRLDQSECQLESLRIRALNSLGHLIGVSLRANTQLNPPPVSDLNQNQSNRPEFKLFQLRMELVDAQSKQLNDRKRPRLAAFGQAGYGKPGLNMLGDSWDPYLLVGIRFSWMPFDWGKVKGEQNALYVNKLTLANAQEAFAQQLALATDRQKNQIAEIESLLQRDEELLEIRKQISLAYASKLKNGIITAATYLTEWNREQEARIALESRKVELVSALHKLNTITGKN